MFVKMLLFLCNFYKKEKKIEKEREKELLMEGTRYFDVLRNGYYKTELYGNFRNVSDQDVVDGVFFNALESTLYWDNPLMRQNTYWLKRQ